MEQQVLIIGGGLAGLTAGIHLSNAGISVAIIEKNDFPRHKVCGEYISNEVLPYFESLGIDIASLHPATISKTTISTVSGKQIHAKLPLGGFGISRYALDHLLYEKAKSNGCKILTETVSDVIFSGTHFEVTANESVHTADVVVGAYGKRANLDQKLERDFIVRKSPWLAVKAHYLGNFPDDLVALHNFRGGYCGVSKVEDNAINVCYLADYESFKKYKDIEEYQQYVLSQNPNLKAIFDKALPAFKPMAISQVSFAEKLPVENHILMVGDSAGLIHPLSGNGMAMAIHSAKIASELIIKYLSGEIDSRKTMEKQYTMKWNEQFRRRMQTGRWLAALMKKEKTANFTMRLLTIFPFLLPMIIKQTHGKPIAA